MENHPLITIDPEIMLGKPTIKGTRLTVELILEQLGSGLTIEELLDSYPHLTDEGIRAALLYAADFLNHEAMQRYEQRQHVAS
ncbi:MAG TPA: DUF433 domain-containing protein [Ktedonobacterales bacterium]|nr:DUF433 domain-containing protein [Ktedonobacterales bacterium]